MVVFECAGSTTNELQERVLSALPLMSSHLIVAGGLHTI